MKVILDANVLVSQHFLKGHLGIVLVYALRRTRGALVLPEYTLREAKRSAIKEASKRRGKIDAATEQLKVLVGRQPNIKWASDEEIGAAIDAHLEAVADVVEVRALDLDTARRALNRVVEHQPPSHDREQFRDALLWEVATSFGPTELVHLVTVDNDFLLANSVGERRLHPKLVRELELANYQLQWHESLAKLLQALGQEATQLDQIAISRALGDSLYPQVNDMLGESYILLEQAEATSVGYVTADPNSLAVSFNVGFEASASSSTAPSTAAIVEAHGSASLDSRSLEVLDIQLERVGVLTPDRQFDLSTTVFIHASRSASTGPWRPYEFQHPLDQT